MEQESHTSSAMTSFLFDGPVDAEVSVLLAHGAGGPMDSASLNATAKALATAGMRVARFEFGYMASRRTSASDPGSVKPSTRSRPWRS